MFDLNVPNLLTVLRILLAARAGPVLVDQLLAAGWEIELDCR